MKVVPRSLSGQVLATAAIALLIAQIFSALLLYRASEDRREAWMLQAAVFQIAAGNEMGRREARRSMRGDRRGGSNEAGFRRLPRALRYQIRRLPPMKYSATAARSEREVRLAALLLEQDIAPVNIAAETRRAVDDPAIRAFAKDRPRWSSRKDWQSRSVLIVAIQREAAGPWEIARVIQPRRDRWTIPALLGQTALLFIVLLSLLFLAVRRITQPLAALTNRVSRFGQSYISGAPVTPAGPTDIRDLITAHNTMERRIAAMLEEKDVMLGAIGHDLKTPLAALRVRIETVPDDAQRARMADSIEDITQTLDDILILARIGKVGPARERTDLRALVQSVAEEFEDLEQPVTLTHSARIVAPAHTTWLKRAVRNLTVNAVRYGGAARISLRQIGDAAEIRVSDDGPGIPDARMEEMLRPFTRGETSRNKATGGAGLGLTLARAIAQQHGGELELSNREGGGLDAVIRIPLGK